MPKPPVRRPAHHVEVGTRERASDRGTRRGGRIVRELGYEFREARIAAGLSQAAVARRTGMSRTVLGRIERGGAAPITVVLASRLAAVLGLDLSVRLYPAGPPLRDAAHVALLEKFKSRVSTRFAWRNEVPVGPPGGSRAWDSQLLLGGDGQRLTLGVEGETRLRDLQATLRRIELKQRDSGVDRVILVLRDSRSNRLAARGAQALLAATFPVGARRLLRALREGRDPGGNGLAML